VLAQKGDQVPQVVGVRTQRVGAVSGIGQVRQKPRHQYDLVACIVDQYDPTDDAAVTFLEHLHTGLLQPVLT
jgi:hypothetical protein